MAEPSLSVASALIGMTGRIMITAAAASLQVCSWSLIAMTAERWTPARKPTRPRADRRDQRPPRSAANPWRSIGQRTSSWALTSPEHKPGRMYARGDSPRRRERPPTVGVRLVLTLQQVVDQGVRSGPDQPGSSDRNAVKSRESMKRRLFDARLHFATLKSLPRMSR